MSGTSVPGEGGRQVSNRQLLAYGQMVVPLAVVGLPVAIYLPPFYAGTLGLDLASVGLILMLARLSDVVTDPLIGRWSDRTRTRWGRRRPWVALGVPLMIVSAVMLFMPGKEVSNLYLLIWISAIYLGFTFITIPFGAWGAELTGDYLERSRITGAREIFLIFGLLVAITAPIVGGAGGGTGANGGGADAASREAMAALGWVTIVLLPVCAFILFRVVPEPPAREIRQVPFMKGLRTVMRNGPFRRILASSMFGAFAGSINGGVALLFFQHALGIGGEGRYLILALFISTAIGAPIWIRMGARLGKHRALAIAGFISMFVFAWVPVVVYVAKPMLGADVIWAMLALTAIQGLTAGATPILGSSMLADVVDLDTIKSGEQRTAFMFSFLGMVRKIFEAAGVGIALPLLAWVGFNPTAESNSDIAIFALTAAYCLVPLVLWTIAISIIWNFPLTHARQTRLRAALDRRNARRALSAQS